MGYASAGRKSYNCMPWETLSDGLSAWETLSDGLSAWETLSDGLSGPIFSYPSKRRTVL